MPGSRASRHSATRSRTACSARRCASGSPASRASACARRASPGSRPGADAVRLSTDAGETVEARLLVAADGAQSAVRSALGIGASIAEYGQHAVIAHVDTTRFHDNTAFERFTETGPLAVLPIVEGRSAIVWTLAPEAARRALALDDARVPRRIAAGLRVAPRPLHPRRPPPGLSARADAGRAAHRAARRRARQRGAVAAPGRGAGLQPGAARRRDARGTRSRRAATPARPRSSIATPTGARRTARRSSASRIRWCAASACRSGPLRRARGQGLLLFDLLRPVKREFARRTMGLAGRQPRLVRGLPLAGGTRMKPDFDVVVVGGAMAGAGTAALLAATPATAGLRIALVEPRPATPPAADAPLDLRVSALSRSSQRLLERTGAWPAVAARAAAYQRMVIWEERQDPAGPDALVFDAAELGEPDLGHIGENLSIQAALTARAEAQGVVLLRAELATHRADPRRDARRSRRRARVSRRPGRRRRRCRVRRAPHGGHRYAGLGLRPAGGRCAPRVREAARRDGPPALPRHRAARPAAARGRALVAGLVDAAGSRRRS